MPPCEIDGYRARAADESIEAMYTYAQASRLRSHAPGLLLCAAAVVIALSVQLLLPGVSPLIVAIVLGIVVTNTVTLPASTAPGLAVASRRLLRLGIVFLGLQLVLDDILSLGAPMLAVVVCVVFGGIFGTLLMGRLLRMRPAQVLLIACGFSICGAAAVAAVEGATDAEEEDVVTAVALVVIFGTLLIPLIPLAGQLLDLGPELTGLWAGASVHEVAQVVATGGLIGGGALSAAVLVKLARVLLLAPVVTVLSVRQRVRQRRSGPADSHAARPPIVPLFILGFLVMVAARSFLDVSGTVLAFGNLAQTALLSAAMFALGCGVRLANLRRVGVRPFILAAASTLLVAAIALAGIGLVQS
ncbi:putative integral membrane protein (TIGR00698 family) [Arthrobacter pigmenti]|uniref:Putative integral membrane protein (TIGR00698 family) n=1 Tax=Arthrobacter pigmenti TaxID=271432 RepID=A0A846RIU6_9MICC|nr:putative sulfate exporter family transporter [Arthrobacter pigmenti]NJC21600.1 putative integral membrane protein (TIGR00698 family) [Arthrobacter pigmenti]